MFLSKDATCNSFTKELNDDSLIVCCGRMQIIVCEMVDLALTSESAVKTKCESFGCFSVVLVI